MNNTTNKTMTAKPLKILSCRVISTSAIQVLKTTYKQSHQCLTNPKNIKLDRENTFPDINR
jgi:hypothetical protein